MLRFLFLILLFVVGLAAAAVWQGEMHHLRRAVPDYLPGWTGDIADDAGVREGQMILPSQGQTPKLTLRWTAKMPGADGFLWDVQLAGQGVDLRAELLLPWLPTRAFLRSGAGAVDLAEVSGGAVTGLIALQALDVEIDDLTGVRRPTGSAKGQAKAVTVQGEELGNGPVAARLEPDGSWQADVSMTEGISPLTGQLSGNLQTAIGQLDVTIADASVLPTSLQSIGMAEGDGLRISLPVPLRY